MFTPPSHEQHIADLPGSMEEVGLGQINCAEKNRDGRSLNLRKYAVNIRFTLHFVPVIRCGSFTDDCISICSAGYLEGYSRCPTASYGRAVAVEIFIQLLFDTLNQALGIEEVSTVVSTLLMKHNIRAISIQLAPLL